MPSSLAKLWTFLTVVAIASSFLRAQTQTTSAQVGDAFKIAGLEKLAYSVSAYHSNDWRHEVYQLTIDSPVPRVLQPANSSEPAWSPDGKKLAFSSFDFGKKSELYVAKADGSDRTQITNHKGGSAATEPSWSPDGKRIAFTASFEKVRTIYFVNEDGTDLQSVTEGEWPRWSPTGNKLVFQRKIGKGSHAKYTLWVTDIQGKNPIQITPNDNSSTMPAWSAATNEIVFASDRGGKMAIYGMSVNGTNVRNIAHADGIDLYAPIVSPDGKNLICEAVVEKENSPRLILATTDGSRSTVIGAGRHATAIWSSSK